MYRMDIAGAGYLLFMEAQRRGLHLIDKFTPLHIYSLPAAPSLKVMLSTDAPREAAAADLLSPSGQIAASLETSGVGASS